MWSAMSAGSGCSSSNHSRAATNSGYEIRVGNITMRKRPPSPRRSVSPAMTRGRSAGATWWIASLIITTSSEPGSTAVVASGLAAPTSCSAEACTGRRPGSEGSWLSIPSDGSAHRIGVNGRTISKTRRVYSPVPHPTSMIRSWEVRVSAPAISRAIQSRKASL